MLRADEFERGFPIRQTTIDGSSQDLDAIERSPRLLACGREESGDRLLHQHIISGVGNVFKSQV